MAAPSWRVAACFGPASNGAGGREGVWWWWCWWCVLCGVLACPRCRSRGLVPCGVHSGFCLWLRPRAAGRVWSAVALHLYSGGGVGFFLLSSWSSHDGVSTPDPTTRRRWMQGTWSCMHTRSRHVRTPADPPTLDKARSLPRRDCRRAPAALMLAQLQPGSSYTWEQRGLQGAVAGAGVYGELASRAP